MKEKNPYPWYSIHHWAWMVRQPGHSSHRLFGGVGYESDPGVYRIIWAGIVTFWWHSNTGWSWSWNFD